MDILIITLLIIVAIILFLVELFVAPGISIAGILAGGCAIYANYYAFCHLGSTGGIITLGVTAVGCISPLVLFMKSKTLERIALKENIDSTVDRTAERSIQIGDTGTCTTRLALIGYAEINGKIVEVKSTDGFLDEKTPIRVVRITDGTLLVEQVK